MVNKVDTRKKPKYLATRNRKNAPYGQAQIKLQGAKDLMSLTMDATHKNTPCLDDVLKLDNKDFEKSQTNWKLAFDIYKEELEVYDNEQCEEMVNEMTEDYKIEEFKEEQSFCLEEAKFYSSMHHIEKVKYVAWVPQKSLVTTPTRYPDGSLKGHYVCVYVDSANEEQTVKVAMEWAEANLNIFFCLMLKIKLILH